MLKKEASLRHQASKETARITIGPIRMSIGVRVLTSYFLVVGELKKY
jgi:hypothetical protein